MLQMFVLALSLYNTWNRGVFLLCKITNLLIYSSKNFNVYVVGEKHKEAVDFIKVALDRSTDNVLGFGIKMGCQKNFNVIVWDEEDIPEEYRV